MNKVKGFKDTIKWYDDNAVSYAKAAERLSPTFELEKFCAYFSPGAKILDAGCGSGRDSEKLRSNGLEVTGIDISRGLIKEARKRYPDVDFVIGNLLNLPFNEVGFDGVWAQASLVHLESPDDTNKALNEFHRVLKSGGMLHVFVKQMMRTEKTQVVSDEISNHDRFFQYYTKDEISRMLQENGFNIIHIEGDVSDPAGRKETKWIWAIAQKII